MLTLEICANSITSAIAAEEGRASRIELCDNLGEGGTTPSYGTISYCKQALSIPVMVLIRPRGGDFVYTDHEFEVMKRDVIHCREAGCEGIVTGILLADGTVDKARTAALISLARPMQVTFHRAFDQADDLLSALNDIISLGCDRVLTSGGQLSALSGISMIRKLVAAAGNRISIMPGAGVNETTIADVARLSGASEFHGSAKIAVGAPVSGGNAVITRTSAAKVNAMRLQLDSLA
ncbi:copper homeostasis protein CutC [Hufsiella ginkgonis]|uniref:PF03932 family protein CutC n=1 Tax=Hufsiella ginkgonis TaxID=2695274 RepID=A0A7K1XXN7_9SPHI|nr:copper homeostasis protein CutC [Hufsiella ginkgonis]MXV15286.1 copper homeostasis protein CutC [Hufsiella ginkgonis]